VVADLTGAYPKCQRVRRGVALTDDDRVLIVDEVVPRKKIAVTWQMHTKAAAVGGQTATLTQGKQEFFVQMLEDNAPALEVQPATVTAGENPNLADVKKLVASFVPTDSKLRISVLLSSHK